MDIWLMTPGYGMENKIVHKSKSQKDRWIWKYIIHAVTVWVLIMLLSIRLLPHMGYEPYRILTGSMEPVLEPGEIVLIDTNDRELEPEDIIAFWEGEHVVIHRVQEVEHDGSYVTKGDANPTKDFNPVNQKEVIGSLWIKLGVWTKIWDFLSSKSRYFLIAVLLVFHGIREYCPKNCGGEKEIDA